MPYVLVAKPDNPNPHYDGFYTGNSYIYQGLPYAVVDHDKSKAKLYTSLGSATNAMKKANDKFENYLFEVKEDTQNV